MNNVTPEQDRRLGILFKNGQVRSMSAACRKRMSEKQMELFLQEAAAVAPGRYSPASDAVLLQLRELITNGDLDLAEEDFALMTSEAADGYLWLAMTNSRDNPVVVTAAQYRRIEEFIFQGLLRIPAGCNLKTIDAVEAQILIAEGEAAFLRRKGE